jgi:hypothetical protein
MSVYLQHMAHTTLRAFAASQPDIALLMEAIFRANGLGMTIFGVLAVFVIVCAFRKGEKWSVPALAGMGAIGLAGGLILGTMVL